jgi:hypothetical protein
MESSELEKKETAIIEHIENPIKPTAPEFKFEVNPSKEFSEQAKDYVGILATQKAVEDDELVDDITEKKKEELKHDADARLKSEQAESKQADIKLQEANYGVYSGVATYAGIKKPLPNKYQGFLFFILIWIQIPILVFFGGITSAINIICDCVNTIVEKLSSIAKSARILVLSLLGLGGIAGVIYLIYRILMFYQII